MKTLRLIYAGFLAFIMSLTFVVCSDDDSNNENRLVGWYTPCTTKASNFDVINRAIYWFF